ncbi:MAG TPA: AlkA N-terminal domain-containing protein [Geobacteraceae bacterium]|nr:AlkA N-terminal domain-containing protein [Geobacteraceae bacterium]
MTLDAEKCYRAIRARDGRFDGVFFTAVVSTGVYCRPFCPAKTPRKQNCRFFPTAAAAEAAGFRPCLRCRPELSPAIPDGNLDSTVRRAFALMQSGEFSQHKIGEIAAELGLSERQLRRLFLQEYGLPPVAFAQTQRLLFAKRLLQETSLSMVDVAFSAGFGSVRRFNTLFRTRYGLAPSAVRRSAPVSAETESIALRLAYRPPFAWEHLLDFLALRAVAGVEAVSGNAYYRSVFIEGHQGWLKVEHLPGKNSLVVTLPTMLVPVLMNVLARLRHLFDLDANPLVIAGQLSSDPRLAPLIAANPGLRVPGAWDGFELAVRAVLGQQVSVRGASTLAARLAQSFGAPSAAPHEAIRCFSPGAKALAAATPEQIAAIGLPLKRAATLHALARAIASGELRLHAGADAETTIGKLKAIPGIGDWTAQYIVMRALHWPDAFPAGDLGLRKALGDNGPLGETHVLRLAEKWRPWRAYAAVYLWSALSAQGHGSPGEKHDTQGETG